MSVIPETLSALPFVFRGACPSNAKGERYAGDCFASGPLTPRFNGVFWRARSCTMAAYLDGNLTPILENQRSW